MRNDFSRRATANGFRWRTLKCACARVLLASGTIVVTACGNDRPTAPSASATDTRPTVSTLGDTSSASSSGTSKGTETASAAGAATTTAPSTPGRFRLERRDGAQLRLNWDWVSAHHYDVSFAGRTVVLNQYYPGHTQDVSDLDLSSDHSYTFRLRAIDEAGNASAPAELLFETTPPAAATNLRRLSTRRVTYSDGRIEDYPDVISFSPGTDNAGPIQRYEAIVDGVSFGSVAGAQTNQFSLFQLVSEAYISIPCGPTSVQMRAYDSSLNASQLSAPLTVMFPVYENCPPPHQDR